MAGPPVPSAAGEARLRSGRRTPGGSRALGPVALGLGAGPAFQPERAGEAAQLAAGVDVDKGDGAAGAPLVDGEGGILDGELLHREVGGRGGGDRGAHRIEFDLDPGPDQREGLGLSSPRSRAPSDSSPCTSSTRTSTPPLTAVTSWKVTLGVGRTAASMGPAMVTGAASTALSRASNRSRCAFQSTNSGAASALMMAAISAKARPNSVVCMSLPGRTVWRPA